jgi:hypothetical protein
MKEILTRLKIFFSPGREEFMFTVCLMLFFPLPSYFVAGKGLIPPFFTIVAVFAYVLPFLSGTNPLLLLYIAVLPLITYTGALAVCKTIKKKKLLWSMAGALVLIACLVPVYFIVDAAGISHTYNAIALYRELF